MEVFDSDGNIKLCQRYNSKHPATISLAAASYTNGNIITCGGYRHIFGVGGTNQCYKFEKGKGWSKLGHLKPRKSYRYIASIPIDGGIIVIGGWDGWKTLKSSQIVLSDGSAIK